MVRHTSTRGPMSAENWNDSLDELAADLTYLAKEMRKLQTLTNTLPNGVSNSTIDAFALGIDGRGIYVDSSLETGTTSTYWESGDSRPKTVEEAFNDIYTALNTAVRELEEEIISSYVAITAAQKTAIGDNIFDASLTSNATSLDGKSENNRLNTIQIARDVYGGAYTLDSDGAANLSYSVKDMVDALLALHNGAWNSDIVVDHSGLSITLAQTSVLASSTYDDNFGGPPANLEEDLNELRTLVKEIKGTAAYTGEVSQLYAAGPVSLEDLMTGTSGEGTKSPNNPWGYKFSDIDDLQPSGLQYMETELVGSGMPNNLAVQQPQFIFQWMINTESEWDGQKFRRMETGVTGEGPFVVSHLRNTYPQVQLVQIDPTVTVSGQYDYTVEHTDMDNFTLTLPAGVVLVSGVIVSLW